MSTQNADTSTAGTFTTPRSQTLHPAEVDFLVQIVPVENPLGLKALQHQQIVSLWKVLVDHDRQVVQMLGLMSSVTMDDRYWIN